jgi:hypothetical protein
MRGLVKRRGVDSHLMLLRLLSHITVKMSKAQSLKRMH